MSKEGDRISEIVRLISSGPTFSMAGLAASVGVKERDDCAIFSLGDFDLAVGSDFVRGPEFYLFQREILNWFDIGRFLVVANASDLAAMGARPLGLVAAIRYSKEVTDREFESLMEGVVTACQRFGMPLVGGDTGGYSVPVLSAAAFGICERGCALLRRNAEPGDVIFCTGAVGGAAAAVAYFTRARDQGFRVAEEKENELRERWSATVPALEQGYFISSRGLSTCAIDTSDGLKASLRQLSEASNTVALVTKDSLPIDEYAVEIGGMLGVDPIGLAVGDSVDFRLVFTTSPEMERKVKKEFRARSWTLKRVGVMASPSEVGKQAGVYLEDSGRLRALPGIEWDQSERSSIDRLIQDGDEDQ